MRLFNKPDWLKPEINETKYYVHLLILALVAAFVLTAWKGSPGVTISTVLEFMVVLLLGDIVAHTVLGLD